MRITELKQCRGRLDHRYAFQIRTFLQTHISDQKDIFTDMFFRSERHLHRHLFLIRRKFFTAMFFRPERHFSQAHFPKPKPGYSELWPNGLTFSCTPAGMGSTPSALCLVLLNKPADIWALAHLLDSSNWNFLREWGRFTEVTRFFKGALTC